MIVSFTKSKAPNGWLGNMSPFKIEWDGRIWNTAEALFQAMRFEDKDIQEQIRAEKSPMGAKIVAKKNTEKASIALLGEQDLSNMYQVLKLKIEQNPDLKQMLLETGNGIIIEDIGSRYHKPGNHKFWGAALIEGKWCGSNTLGKLWMKLRKEITNES